MITNEAQFDRALGRIGTSMMVLGLAGGTLAFAFFSWRHGLGFLAGAMASIANFRWLHQLTASLGPSGQRARRRVLFFLAVRYFLLGIGGYVIVSIVRLDLTAALAGLFVAVAAVIVEIIYELIYARA